MTLRGNLTWCDYVCQARAAGGVRSGPVSRNPPVHGAVLPPLHLLPLPGAEGRHAEGADQRSLLLLGAGAHHRGVQEPGQDAGSLGRLLMLSHTSNWKQWECICTWKDSSIPLSTEMVEIFYQPHWLWIKCLFSSCRLMEYFRIYKL